MLPPCAVCPAKRVTAQSREIAPVRLRCLMESIANTGVPQRLSRRSLLLEHERIRRGIVLSGFRRIARGQVADSKDSFAVLTFRTADVLMPHALLDTDGAGIQVHVPP